MLGHGRFPQIDGSVPPEPNLMQLLHWPLWAQDAVAIYVVVASIILILWGVAWATVKAQL